jgi:hypothetical protein
VTGVRCSAVAAHVTHRRTTPFRAKFRFEMTFPYLVAGTAEAPCWQENPGQMTTVTVGEGTATHLGPATTHAIR